MNMTPPAAAPVIPDTANAVLIWPEDSVLPVALTVVPDTVFFGEVAAIVFEFPAGAVLPLSKDLELTADWLSIPESVAGEHLDMLEGLAHPSARPAAENGAESNSLLIPIRVYRTDPFRLVCGQVETGVIHVRGRTTDLATVAPIRGPRLRGWNLLAIALIALALTLLALLIWLRWRRRTAFLALVNWDPASPAWIAASGRLHQLLASGSLDRGLGREFLNDLAAIARGFAGDRYGIAAREMTGQEIVGACLDRGFSVTAPRKLSRLIEDADRRRYDPEPVDPAWCRKQAGQLIDQMSAVRIVPQHTPVPADVRLGAEKTWAELQSFLAESGPPTSSAGIS